MTATDARSDRGADRDPWDLPVVERARSPLRATLAWLCRRHRLPAEVLIVLVLYGAYDTSRGLVRSGLDAAVAHAHIVYTLERGLHLDVERTVQRLAGEVPGLSGAFSWGYTVLHLAATLGVLLWLHRTNAAAYVRLRLALLVGSSIALVGFLAWPTAPPRLDGIGVLNTISHVGINLDSRTLELLYNPYAAFPSLHETYAVLVGFALWRWGRRRYLRVVGVFYPVWVAVEVIATGNHFVVDVLAGAGVAAVGLVLARRMTTAATELGRDQPQPAEVAP